MAIVVKIIVVYLALSLMLAIFRILRYAEFERGTGDVPQGDLCFYQAPVLFDWLTTLFFPAVLFIHAWCMIVRLVNEAINR